MGARAIAGESQVSFIHCTGSNFDEMFVGLGAKRVRELFAEARKNTPCIIFIDEIDSLISKGRRQSGEGSSSRATINQLLAEIDGFEQQTTRMLLTQQQLVPDVLTRRSMCQVPTSTAELIFLTFIWTRLPDPTTSRPK